MADILGVIGGSGLYEMEGLMNVRRVKVRTPFGDPSDSLVVGDLEGRTLAFLPRHGRGHRIPPSRINFRANIYAMKKIGARRVLSLSAVGSMREKIRPGDIVVVDQFFDHTRFRPNTYFSDGIVGHIPFADPVCPALADIAYLSARKVLRRVHRGGTYLCMEGPAFSTRAESRIYRRSSRGRRRYATPPWHLPPITIAGTRARRTSPSRRSSRSSGGTWKTPSGSSVTWQGVSPDRAGAAAGKRSGTPSSRTRRRFRWPHGNASRY
jgi:hypothetical protein